MLIDDIEVLYNNSHVRPRVPAATARVLVHRDATGGDRQGEQRATDRWKKMKCYARRKIIFYSLIFNVMWE